MRKLALLLLLIPVITGSKLFAISSSNVINTSFLENEIVVKKGTVTTLQFSSVVNYFIVGDELIAEASRINSNTILVSPKLANEQTNLNVSTKDGVFIFVIRTIDYESREEPNLHVNIGSKASSYYKLEKDLKKEEAKNSKNPKYDYDFSMYSETFCGFWFCDYKKIAPNRVWTDGQYTYLDYSTQDGTYRTIPNVQEVADDIDIPVNKIIKGNVIVVHTLAKKITIVANGAYVCIKYDGDKYEIK